MVATSRIDCVGITVPVPDDDAADVLVFRDGDVHLDGCGPAWADGGRLIWPLDASHGERDRLMLKALTREAPRVVALARGVFGEGWAPKAKPPAGGA